MSLSIAIAGAGGRMGRALINAARDDQRFRVAGGTERGDAVSRDLGALAGGDPLGVAASADASAASNGADIWIDFTTPAATLEALRQIKTRAAIIGTTGFDDDGRAKIAEAAQTMPTVFAGNFSLGVTLLAALVEQTAAKLGPGWDIEIADAHHRRKVDAPSGTALMLGEAAARGRGMTLSQAGLPPHHGETGPRAEGGIGFSVTRAGGIVGEHDVRFVAEREIVTLSHQALDRAVFADGALAAALWVADKPPGLYSMRDVLGL